ncbi:putative protein TPRXL [Penaeus monodon]|uniref:putative protein TPRXL n=1 Tax=Penaeus monodon TaxID=6687 RepID=UPI0018A71B31|nr:putative protein TPRXL [Penaeus monodon]
MLSSHLQKASQAGDVQVSHSRTDIVRGTRPLKRFSVFVNKSQNLKAWDLSEVEIDIKEFKRCEGIALSAPLVSTCRQPSFPAPSASPQPPPRSRTEALDNALWLRPRREHGESGRSTDRPHPEQQPGSSNTYNSTQQQQHHRRSTSRPPPPAGSTSTNNTQAATTTTARHQTQQAAGRFDNSTQITTPAAISSSRYHPAAAPQTSSTYTRQAQPAPNPTHTTPTPTSSSQITIDSSSSGCSR